MGQTKVVKTQIPIELHRAFVRTFPQHGERGAFIRQMISYAVRCAEEKDCFIEQVRRLIEEDLNNG